MSDLGSEIGSAFVRIRPNTAGFSEEAKGGISGSLKGLAEMAAGAFAAVKVGDFVKQSIEAARQMRIETNLTNAVIRSTGGAAHVTGSQISDLTTRLSENTGITEEQVRANENMLLRFTDVRNEVGKGNDIFNRASQAVLDLSVGMGKNGTMAAKSLARALEDPTKGLSLLARSGVAFTAQQTEQIKAMAKSGNLLGAQKLILDQVNRAYGGAAAAAADPEKKLSAMWTHVKEVIGNEFLPVLDKVAQWLSGYLPSALAIANHAFSTFAGWVGTGVYYARIFAAVVEAAFNGKDLTKTGYGFVTVAARIGEVLRTVYDHVLVPVASFLRDHWRGSLEIAAIALAAFVAPIPTLVAGLIYAYNRFEVFRDVVQAVARFFTEKVVPAFQVAFAFIKREVALFIAYWQTRWNDISAAVSNVVKAIEVILAPALLTLRYLWDAFGKDILAILQKAFTTILAVLKGAFSIIKGIFDVFLGLLSGHWSRAWNGLKQIFSGVWQIISSLLKFGISTMLRIFAALAGQVVGILKSFGLFIWDHALSPAISWVLGRIKRYIDLWIDVWIKFPARVVMAVVHLGQTIWSGILGGLNWLKNEYMSYLDTVVGFWTALPGRIVAGLANIGTTLWNGVKAGIGWFHDRIFDAVNTIASLWSGITGGLHEVLRAVVHTLFLGINAAYQVVLKAVDAWNNIPGNPAHITGLPRNISEPSFARGGVVDRPTQAIVGDAGPGNPEIVTPERLMRDVVMEALSSVLGRNGPSTIPLPRWLSRQNDSVEPFTRGQVAVSAGRSAPLVGVMNVTAQDPEAAARASMREVGFLLHRQLVSQGAT